VDKKSTEQKRGNGTGESVGVMLGWPSRRSKGLGLWHMLRWKEYVPWLHQIDFKVKTTTPFFGWRSELQPLNFVSGCLYLSASLTVAYKVFTQPSPRPECIGSILLPVVRQGSHLVLTDGRSGSFCFSFYPSNSVIVSYKLGCNISRYFDINNRACWHNASAHNRKSQRSKEGECIT
jgi:hypothetical protein